MITNSDEVECPDFCMRTVVAKHEEVLIRLERFLGIRELTGGATRPS